MKKIFKNMDIPLMIAVIIMCIIGVMFVLSASSVRSVFETVDASPYYYFKKQLIYMIISFIAGLFILCKSTKFVEKLTLPLWLAGVLMLIVVLFVGVEVNGTKGWLNIANFTIQPSEFMKLIMIIFLGKFFSNPNRSMEIKDLIFFGLFCAIPIILIYAENDTGTSILLALIIFITFMTIPLKHDVIQKYALILGGALALFFVILLLSGVQFFSGYKAERLKTKDPCKRYYEVGTGYQVCNGYIAINNGGLFGVGLGNSTQKYLYLPEAHTDFIFPIIVEEIGVIPSILLVLLYIFILFRLYRISQIASTLRGSIIAFGVFVYISLHFLINIGGVLSIIPLTGVPLLFLSSGGSALFTAIISIFIVERIAAESKIENASKKLKRI